MMRIVRFFSFLLILSSICFSYPSFADESINVPILCYHNFNPTKPGSMNLTPQKLEAQIKWIKDNGYTIIPLKDAVDYLRGARSSLPPKSIVITVDDGWESAYTYLYPIVKKYNIPVTLFIFPQTISAGKNSLTWEQLKELQKTGLFDIQGHTYWHPNFKQEKRRMSEAQYQKFVTKQLVDSKKMLEDKLGTKVTILAWPYGIYDSYLEQQAANAGYTMAFSIDARTANRSYRPMAQPRYMIVDGLSNKRFAYIVNTANSKPNVMSAKK